MKFKWKLVLEFEASDTFTFALEQIIGSFFREFGLGYTSKHQRGEKVK